MRPRGQTPRMLEPRDEPAQNLLLAGFNEAAGADPADASGVEEGGLKSTPPSFNEAAGADPADAG